MIRAAKILNKLGVKNILLKGGHRDGKIVTDILLNKNKLVVYKNKKIKTKNTHGTGCTLSSAVATFIACGKTINKSCELAIKYVNESIRSNPNFGKGHGPINHLSSIRIDRKYK
jgi:hydroxymethylpyrimidine kinase/phosphomethylpyrimidine kinase